MKRLFVLSTALLAFAAYADVKISELPDAAALTGAEQVPAVQTGATVKTTTGDIADLVLPVELASEVSGTLPVANGGTNLAASADDNVMVGNGTTWQTKAIPNCTDTNGQHLNYTASSNAFSCGTSTGTASGTFNVTWSTGCTTQPTQSFSYAKTGNIVVLTSTQNISCTSNAAQFSTAISQIPAAALPASGVDFYAKPATNNGTGVMSCIRITTSGQLIAGTTTGGPCDFNGWTASGSKGFTNANLGAYPGT